MHVALALLQTWGSAPKLSRRQPATRLRRAVPWPSSTGLILLLASVGAAVGSGCNDPVPDAEIAVTLGPEPKGSPGPDHRPGQPCVLCHSDGGPASDRSRSRSRGPVYKNSEARLRRRVGPHSAVHRRARRRPLAPPT